MSKHKRRRPTVECPEGGRKVQLNSRGVIKSHAQIGYSMFTLSAPQCPGTFKLPTTPQ